jgi:hypothetical protein
MVQGKRSDIGLGSLSVRTLAEARQQAAELRSRARGGEDIVRRKQVEKRKARTPTFEQAAASVHEEQVVPALKNETNKVVWLRSLEMHVFPVFGKKTVDAIDSADVLKAIGPLWAKKPDVARKTLRRIERVMNWATLKKYRDVIAGDIVLQRRIPAWASRWLCRSSRRRPAMPRFLCGSAGFSRQVSAHDGVDCGEAALELTLLTVLRLEFRQVLARRVSRSTKHLYDYGTFNCSANTGISTNSFITS